MDKPPRRSSFPLLDQLGELCFKGKDAAAYLWQVPHDEAVRAQIVDLLGRIRDEATKAGRREMGLIVQDLSTAASASPSPQQVEILQDGFDRLCKLWAAAKSGLM